VPTDDAGPIWLRVLDSKGGAALITAGLAGLLGQWIAAGIQDRSAEKERSRIAYEQHLTNGLTVLTEFLTVAGEMLAATENLVALGDSVWAPSLYEGEARARVEADRVRLVGEFNEAVGQWQRRREVTGFLMSYYWSSGGVDIEGPWRRAQGRRRPVHHVCQTTLRGGIRGAHGTTDAGRVRQSQGRGERFSPGADSERTASPLQQGAVTVRSEKRGTCAAPPPPIREPRA